MENIYPKDDDDVRNTVKAYQRQGWYVIRYKGCAFKVTGKWAQLMIAANHVTKDSGSMFHKSQAALVDEILEFANKHGEKNAEQATHSV
jgi:hypothetical protein